MVARSASERIEAFLADPARCHIGFPSGFAYSPEHGYPVKIVSLVQHFEVPRFFLISGGLSTYNFKFKVPVSG
jgi:hypothetical protein